MMKLARDKQLQRRLDLTPVRAPAPVISAGKQSLTAHLEAGSLGAPDHYTRAIEGADRELSALRGTALPAYIAVLRRRDCDPLTREIERVRCAGQIRYLLASANRHVYALEGAAVFRDPLVLFLRASVDALVVRATRLGVYAGAENQIPKRFVDEPVKRLAGGRQDGKQTPRRTPSEALVRKRRRLARGTSTPPAGPPARITLKPAATGQSAR